MGTKYTYDSVKLMLSEEGYTLLSREYSTARDKIKYMCPKGHTHDVVFHSWIRGFRCPCCNKELRSLHIPEYKEPGDIKVDGIIYKVTCLVNSKVYIGQTIYSLDRRRRCHLERLNKEVKYRPMFHKALLKHGIENFTWEIIERCETKLELDEMEFHYIMQYDSFKNGYNMTMGGEGTVGRKQTEASKKLISLHKKGKKMSEATKLKWALQRRGVKKSPEHVLKVAEAKSLLWEITFPDGKKEVIKNLSEFNRLHNLTDMGLRNVASGLRNHHKGFKCIKVTTTKITN